jgi:superfamily II DNA or RNA helicase
MYKGIHFYSDKILPYTDYLREKYVRVNPMDLNDVQYLVDGNRVYRGLIDQVEAEIGFSLDPINTEYEAKSSLFKFTHRDHQHEAVTELLVRNTGIIQASPGVGKTVMIADICARLYKCEGKIIVISENTKPHSQIYNTLIEACPTLDVGRLGNGYNDIDSKVIVAMRQSLVNSKYDDLLTEATTVIVDECHHGVTDQYISIYNRCENLQKLYGVSATPYRDDEKHDLLNAIFGRVRYKIDYGEAIQSGMLCPIVVIAEKIPKMEIDEPKYTKTVTRIDTTTGKQFTVEEALPPWIVKQLKSRYFLDIYDKYIQKNTVRNMCAINFAKKLNAKGKSCVIIVSRVVHANELHALMPDAVILHSGTPKKKKLEIFADLETKQTLTVISTLFDEAVDVKSLDGVAIVAAGKNSVKIIQRIRSTRKFEGYINGKLVTKDVGYLYYPIDQTGFFAGQSRICLKYLKEEVAKSDKNTIHFI